jgi:hypothetical protein
MTNTNIRVIARFVPQTWSNDYAIDNEDDAFDFDVTDTVATMTLTQLCDIVDDSYEADALWEQHPLHDEKNWGGPFKIQVESSIEDYIQTRINAACDETPDLTQLVSALITDWAGTLDELLATATMLREKSRVKELP